MDKSTQPSKASEKNELECTDAAWAIIHTPLSAAMLKRFCLDIERLFRINPMLNFRKWQTTGAERYYFMGQNISQDPPFDFAIALAVKQLSNGVQIDYDQGIKTRTTFIIEPLIKPLSGQPNKQKNNQSKLTITEFYDGLSEAERRQRLHLVDKSITAWANDLQRYLVFWEKFSRYRLWRWYMQHIWQPMRPMGRRITYILLWLTCFELILILLVAGIYFLEH